MTVVLTTLVVVLLSAVVSGCQSTHEETLGATYSAKETRRAFEKQKLPLYIWTFEDPSAGPNEPRIVFTDSSTVSLDAIRVVVWVFFTPNVAQRFEDGARA